MFAIVMLEASSQSLNDHGDANACRSATSAHFCYFLLYDAAASESAGEGAGNTGSVGIPGQPLAIPISLCMPVSCNATELAPLILDTIGPLLESQLGITPGISFECPVRANLAGRTWLAVITALLFILAVVGTVGDAYWRSMQSQVHLVR